MTRESMLHWASVSILAVGVTGCEGPRGLQGEQGQEGSAGASCSVTNNGDGTKTISCTDGTSVTVSDGVAVGALTGTVTNQATGAALSGATVALSPAIEGVDLSTSATGTYSAVLPVGVYSLSFEAAGFETITNSVTILADQDAVVSVAMEPKAAVVVEASAGAAGVDPAGTTTLTATVESYDGSSPVSYAWTQIEGLPATITGADTASLSVTLGPLDEFLARLWAELDLPDRPTVAPINPHALEVAEEVMFEVAVTMDDGSVHKGTVAVMAHLPVGVSTGLRNVPIDVAVLLHAPTSDDGTYSWTLDTTGASGSAAAIASATMQNAYFTPDVAGEYVISESNTGSSITMFATTWGGAIAGIAADDLPNVASCKGCHAGAGAPTEQFDAWRQSGHAHIFSTQIDTSTHYSPDCFTCHTVGYDTAADNGGIDDQSTYDDFLAELAPSGSFHADPDNWVEVATGYPAVARFANIQCENCHGPQAEVGGATLHVNGTIDSARVTIASEMCGSCHGEPLRHGRYQQWKESGHGNFELAIEEGAVENRAPTASSAGAGHCGRCHSGQGFLAWIANDDLPAAVQDRSLGLPEQTAQLAALGLTEAEVQPITCVTCHDPHDQGTTSSEPNTATVRIVNSTKLLPAGFRAVGVGRGALCMTCHNTRGGLHNDATPPTSYSAPHTAAQADVVMGENAYFVDVGARSPHSYIADSCTNCHLRESPPPAAYSMSGGGTNHGFKASMEVCAECHGESIDGEALAESVHAALADVEQAAGELLIAIIAEQVAAEGSYFTGSLLTDVPTAAVPAEVRGQSGFTITLADATEVTFRLGDLLTAEDGSPLVASDSVLTKAMWNYYLIEGDGSFGGHNPAFTFDVLNATYNELVAANQ